MSTQAAEFAGSWWLPSTPDRKVPGTLRVNESGEVSLDLIGSLRPPFADGVRSTTNGVTTIAYTEDSGEAAGTYPRIAGEAGGRAITLEDCFQTASHRQLMGEVAVETVHVHKAFVGVWLDESEPLAFSKVSVWLDWFVYWVDQSAIRRPIEFEEREKGDLRTVAAELRAELLGTVASFAAPGGLTVSIEHVVTSGGDSTAGVHLTQDFVLTVQAKGVVDLDRLMRVAGCIQAIVAIGVDRPAAFRQVQVFHPDVLIGKTEHLAPIEYLARWQQPTVNEIKTLYQHDMPFTLTALGGGPGLAELLKVALLHESTLHRVLATQHSDTMYSSDRLLNVVASLEGYHRKRRLTGSTQPTKKHELKDKLKLCVGSMGVPARSLVKQPDVLVKRLNSARQEVAHHYETINERALDHYYLARAGYLVYVLCLLHEAGAPAETLDRVLDRPRTLFDRRRIEQVLAPKPNPSGRRHS